MVSRHIEIIPAQFLGPDIAPVNSLNSSESESLDDFKWQNLLEKWYVKKLHKEF